jgi:prepilin-type N-terminal cleavage/methylation domain-containing protein
MKTNRSLARVGYVRGFSLVEVMVSLSIFSIAFTGVFLVYGQTTRTLDGLRQASRGEDVAISNIEFIRTRSWTQLTAAMGGSTTSSNLTEGIPYNASLIPSNLTLLASDPQKIGLKNGQRDISIVPYPSTSANEPMRRVTVNVSWEIHNGRRLTNSMTIYVTKGGLTADVL